jgi:tetratricopeptide (TPR) repeat protein
MSLSKAIVVIGVVGLLGQPVFAQELDAPLTTVSVLSQPLSEQSFEWLETLAEAQKDLQEGEDELAIGLFLKILASETPVSAQATYAPIYFYLGLAYYNLRLYSFALDAFEQSQRRWQNPPPNLFFSLGMAQYYAHFLDAAQDNLNRVITDPNSSSELKQAAEEQLLLTLRDQSGAYQEGLKAYQEGRFADAVTQLEIALKFLPNSGEIHYYLGASQIQIQNYDAARAHFLAVLKNEPNSDIAQQAQLTLDVIDKLSKNMPQKPLYGSVVLGGFADSNVNFGGPTDNTTILPAGATAASNLIDAGLQMNLTLGYQWLSEWGVRYNLFLQQYLGLLDSNILNLKSSDYNLQLHSMSLLNHFDLSDSLDLSITTQGDLQFLGSKPFFWGGFARPVITWYASDRLVSRLSFSLGGERYSEFQERDNINHQLGLEQYIYLWGSQTWLRFGYDWLQVYARDNLQQRVLNSNNDLFEVDYRFANSRAAHQVGLSFGFPLGPLQLELGSRLDFIDYTQPDLVSQYLVRINPTTGLALPRQELGSRSVEKLRADTRLNFYLQMEWAFSKDLKLQGRYSRTTNVSNITPDDYSTSRSYLKDVLNMSLRYDF